MRQRISNTLEGIAEEYMTTLNNVVVSGYICPVCGFNMSAKPADFNICPSCGTEFGNDDADWTHEQLRAAWLENGARWFSRTTTAPAAWNPVEQVLHVIQVRGSKDERTTISEYDRLSEFGDPATGASSGTWIRWRASSVSPCHV